ncbi:hypothetical protein ATANTOWER_003347 [Ataeniobius toweri]|uniref:Uncharacterized protein n=1 Tax=Ataeniobius toweri TaxID=208326 RepID=A0ABU7AIZ9_9TELE|nr:hypothetical protein [Ataeniobius toweri]
MDRQARQAWYKLDMSRDDNRVTKPKTTRTGWVEGVSAGGPETETKIQRSGRRPEPRPKQAQSSGGDQDVVPGRHKVLEVVPRRHTVQAGARTCNTESWAVGGERVETDRGV